MSARQWPRLARRICISRTKTALHSISVTQKWSATTSTAVRGGSMYLTCFTRGDCSFAVNQCARFMHNPGPTHIAAIKRVLRYLAGTRNRGITYRRDAPDPAALAMGKHVGANQITPSADADHAGAKDRRSISGYAIMLSGAVVMWTWTSKRQPVTAISSTESEFYSVSQCALD